MANALYEENDIQDIANAIREQGGTDTYTVSEMGDAIRTLGTPIDSELSITSTNPVQNKVVTEKFNELSKEKVDYNEVATYITPEMFGAKGDGSTDDSTAIQNAIDNAGSGNVVYLSRKTYKISKGIQLTHSNRRFKCDGTILYSGTDTAVLIGSHHVYADIDIITATNGTAVKLSATEKYVEYCTVNVGQITASKIGLHMYLSGYALVYNQIRIGEINATDTGVLVWADGGVCNENWYYLGRIGGCSTGIKIHSDESLNVQDGIGANTNRFFSGSFEHLKDDATAIVLERTKGNTFQNMRCAEYYGSKSLVLTGYCSDNTIGLSMFVADEIDFSGLEHGSVNNCLYGQSFYANNDYDAEDGWRPLSENARIDWDYGLGFTYNTNYTNYHVSATDYADYHIKQIGKLIPTSVIVDDASLNGKTMKLSAIYSDMRSLARGSIVTFQFGETNGKILLQDVYEKTILDNTDGQYLGKTVIVQWVGTNNDAQYLTVSNNWNVQVLGENPITESDLASKKYATESFVTNKIAEAQLSGEKVDLSGYAIKADHYTKTESDNKYQPKGNYLTQHQDISGKVDKTDAITLTGIDENGNTHMWTIYGKVVS